MHSIIEGFAAAFRLIIGLNPELLRIILLSLQVSGSALAAATLLGLPVGACLALRRVPLRGLVLSLLNTGMGLPPVAEGLFLYLLLSRSGPLGVMELLYTPSAMVIAQSILAFPIVASLSQAAIAGVDPIIRQAAVTLGATPFQESLAVIREARYAIVAGILAGLGRVMAEVGAIIIVGGNIAGYTRVMTTTIALETDKGNFELAIALGIILLVISFAITVGLRFFQRLGRSGISVQP
ncbi:MAG: ABC transporter permease [Deltaproteobacteria bacterium]|nr:ABC transporter permease [Deltaproteobacteria bacterium]